MLLASLVLLGEHKALFKRVGFWVMPSLLTQSQKRDSGPRGDLQRADSALVAYIPNYRLPTKI